jgi:NAD(P)-dependent dehydrogenase (short-subunit alcohol dehydrogenase family)
MHVLIVGASRGLGLEFVRQYRADGAQVSATARDDAGLQRLAALGASSVRLDVTAADAGAMLAAALRGTAVDIAIVNAGVYGSSSTGLQPPSSQDFDLVMHTNVLGPMRVLPALAETLAPGARVGVISSRMGSIGLRAAANGWLYRASKAAVNSVLKDASLVLAGRAVCVALHPGWVRTDMGGAGADLDVATSVADLRRTLAGLGPEHNGRFFNHDGTELAW